MAPILILTAAAIATGWWRSSRPPVRDVPPLAAALGFTRRRKRFLGREYDAGEPARATRRGYSIALEQHDEPVGPGDVSISLRVSVQLHRRAQSGLSEWLTRHPASNSRLNAAGDPARVRWRLGADGRRLDFTWDDPRTFEWSTERLDACIEALLDLAEALDSAAGG